MADAVDTLDVFSGRDILIRRITNRSDGTGETNVAKVTKASLLNPNVVIPTKLGMMELWWSIQGFSSVQLNWDHTTPDEIAILAAGNGAKLMGGSQESRGVLWDPASAGGTGNIILTTFGAVNNATYDILMKIRLSGNAS